MYKVLLTSMLILSLSSCNSYKYGADSSAEKSNLTMGISFTNDMLTMVNNIAKQAGVNNLTLGKLIYGGCTLQQHWQFYSDNSAVYDYAKSVDGGGWVNQSSKTFLNAIQDEHWDIIVIQQASQDSGRWSTIEPYIYNLIDAMVTNCSNNGVTLAWHSTWAYATNSTHAGFVNYGKNQMTMYNSIQDVAKKIIKETGIDLIISSGTAIQNMRTTTINNAPNDLTTDGYHLEGGLSRLIASYAFFEAILSPIYNLSTKDNPYTPPNAGGNTINVTTENKKLASWAAKYAYTRRFEVTEIQNKLNVNQ